MKHLILCCVVVFLSAVGFRAWADKIDNATGTIAVDATDEEEPSSNNGGRNLVQ